MSYNVDSVDEVKLNAWMYAKDITRFHRTMEEELPEMNFIAEHFDAAVEALENEGNLAKVELKSFEWCGTWSGNGVETLEKKILPKIMGEVKVIFNWEGGDCSALTSKDGVAARRGVKKTIDEDEDDE